MPLYQEPAVYVEEQPPQVTPIPAASTSIAGFVGVTERGPLLPQLVTSLGGFLKTYGGPLDRQAFTVAGRGHHYLPDAVAGFFQNLGQVCYVVRVVPPSARRGEFALADTGVGGQSTRLLFGAPQGSGTALNQPLVYVLADGLAVGDEIQIGAGSEVENHVVADIDTITSLTLGLGHVALANALARTVAAGATVDEVTRAPNTAKFAGGSGAIFDLAEDAAEGAMVLIVDTNAADGAAIGSAGGDFIEIGGDTPVAQFVRATGSTAIGPTRFRVTLADSLVQGVTAGVGILTALDVSNVAGSPGTLARDAAAGTTLLAVNDLGAAPNLRTADELVLLSDGGGALAVARVADVGLLALDWPLAQSYAAGSRVRLVAAPPFARLAGGGGSTSTFDLNDTDGLHAGMPVIVGLGTGDETVTVTAVDAVANEITVTPALTAVPAAANPVTPAYALTGAASEGVVQIGVNCRLGLDPVGDRRALVEIGLPGEEFLSEIADLPGPRGVAPDAGSVILTTPLPQPYPAGTPVRILEPTVVDAVAGRPRILVDAPEGAEELAVSGGPEFVAAGVIEVEVPGGVRYHRLSAPFDGAILPSQVTLSAPLARSHPAGAAVVERTPILRVEARDQGSAGNRLRISVAREAQGLLSVAEVTAQPAADQIRLDTVNGVYPGSVIEFVDPATGVVQGPPAWVATVDRAAGNLVTFGANLAAANLPVVGREARSVEYRITVYDTVRVPPGQPEPTNPVVETELFENLSLNPLHPRYAPAIIGDVAGPLDPLTGLTVGGSRFVRVEDLAANPLAALQVRAFATLTDTLPSGVVRPARHPLIGGTDDVNLINDNLYRGIASNDPAARTAIEALRNLRDVSMIACPAQTTVPVQARLIEQCEDLRDRFALLDLPESATTIQAARAHRQNYDTRYAAMFYPWLRILDPDPGASGLISTPPSGYMAGIYARTDLQRGVFKAPANEVVMGIADITEKLGGVEHGLLNADAVQINVIRRYEDRGIRLMGARCICSDPAERYVNVRRFVIFLTVSLEAGLQSVIFEPNDRRLWGRVTRSITNFLLTQWRDGALFGATPEQAFFVRCDETTMTEDDILNGRLICLVGIAPVRPAEFIIIRLQKDGVGLGG